MMNEMRKLMETLEQIDESTRQTLGMWQDYDPEAANSDESERETDPKILAYDKENRELHKELYDEELVEAPKVPKDVRGYEYEEGQEIAMAKSSYSQISGAHVEIRTVSKIHKGKVYVAGSNGTGNYWLRNPQNAAILD